MILNETYYQKLLEKFNDVQHLETNFSNNVIGLTVKIVLKHYQENRPIHINFQNSKETLFKIANHLYAELANDIYNNHYDLPGINDDRTITNCQTHQTKHYGSTDTDLKHKKIYNHETSSFSTQPKKKQKFRCISRTVLSGRNTKNS